MRSESSQKAKPVVSELVRFGFSLPEALSLVAIMR